MRVHPGLIVLCLLLPAEGNYAALRGRPKFNVDAWVRVKVDALVNAAHRSFENDDARPAYRRLLGSINETIRRRRLSEDEHFAERYREFAEYVQAASLDQQPGHQLGFIVPDKQYFAETKQYVNVPEFLMDQTFLRWVSRYETLDRAKGFLRLLNSMRESSDQLLFFSYKSRHLGTPDNDDSYRRLLIVVPGNAETGVPEKWVQFGVTDPRASTRIRNVSVVAVVAGPDAESNTYFKDYYRTYRRNGSISIKGRWELGYGDDNCVRCHKSGVLPIFPEEGSVSPGEQPAVVTVNKRFMTYNPPRFDKYLDSSKFGPGLGSATGDERRRRFGEVFSKRPIAEAMTCSACHQQQGLGDLNWPMDQVLISSYIKGGQMPLGNALEVSERDLLYKALIEEYFATDKDNPGILKSWLLRR